MKPNWTFNNEPRLALFCLLILLAMPSTRAAMLNASFTPLPAGSAVNLSTEGTLDWVQWGLGTPADLNRRNGIAPAIPNFSGVGVPPLEQTKAFAVASSWTNGTPTLEASNATGAVFVRGMSNGFAFSLAANTQPRRLRVHVGGFVAEGRFEARLSDSSAISYADTSLDSPFDATNGFYTLDFAAASTGQTLDVKFTMSVEYDASLSSIFLQAATLASTPTNQPPSVSIACPTNQANFPVSDAILLCADATDSDGFVAKVEFFFDATKVGEATNSPFTFGWANATPGIHTLTAVATDNLGARRTSPPVTVIINSGLGFLTVAGAPPPTAINLTTEGLSDWAHWGLETEASFNHKAGVSQQISNYTLAGIGTAYAYFDNIETYTWTDGTPTPSIFNYPAGVYCPGLGEGFEVRVAADTTVKTLKLYLGAYGARGRLQAWLDDYSAPVLVDESLLNLGNGPGIAYTIQFRASAPGQSLVLRYTAAEMHDSFGNVTLQAATLVSENNPPTATLTAPTNNSVLLAPATITLRAEASDADGSVTRVEFFNGTTKLGQTTAIPHEFVLSNLPAGNFSVSARVTDDEGATYTTPPASVHVITGGGVLSGSFALPPAQVNLSAEGTLDWGHWGISSRNSFVRKLGGSYLPNVSILSGPRQRYTDNATGFSWTNGTPTLTANNSTTGIYVTGRDNGFQFTVPADRTPRRLRLHVGLYGARGRFEASLSDFSAAPFIDESFVSPFGNGYRVYTLYFAAASPAQSLSVRWTSSTAFDEHFGNVTWQAATVSLPDLRLIKPRWEANGFTFSVMSEAGRGYVVEKTETLLPGTWTPLTNFIGNGSEWNVTDPSALSPNRSYRLRLP